METIGDPSAKFADPGSKLVLVIDDDEGVRGFIETVLLNEGFQVQTAADGNEAMEKVRQKAPDLVITDLMMPGSGGYDVLRGLQADGRHRIPVIVCTARNMDPSTEEMIRNEANVAEFIHKPVSVPILLRIVWNLLKVNPRKKQDAPPS